jgi:predicted small lipoprotein YifL
MRRTLRTAITFLAALSLAGCGILFPTASQRAGKNTPGFKAGYSDGCASATIQDTNYRHDQVRDEASYKNDKHYRAGWSAGFSSCRTNLTRDPATGPIPDNNPGGHHY